LWGARFLFLRITTPAFGAFPSAFLLLLFSAIALVLLLGVQGNLLGYPFPFTSPLQLGVINSGLPFLMYCLAAPWLPAGYSATLNATAPMMGVLIGALCFAEPLTLRKGGGAILGAIGVAVIARPTSGLSAALLLPGIGACLTATAC
ncbi:EamA family transporter, partial [Pseudomonas aeruginosa]|uniref:EamA family transporter n=1 Tax=Pseudomonas aeruginosa TaxID=287 RepID=UPI0018DE5910